jgi:hypothetical protein
MEELMSRGGAGAAGAVAGAGAAVAAAAIRAIHASGVLMRLDPAEFLGLLARMKDPLVVTAESGVSTSTYQYMTTYKGLAFYTRSKEPLALPHDAEMVAAKSLWMPA